MQVTEELNSSIGDKGRAIYNDKLKSILEPSRNGEWVAIHVESRDYAVSIRRADADRELHSRHGVDGRLLATRVEPPTDADFRLAHRLNPAGGSKPR